MEKVVVGDKEQCVSAYVMAKMDVEVIAEEVNKLVGQ